MTNNKIISMAAGAVIASLILKNTSIGQITRNRSVAYQKCASGSYTTSNMPGRCSYHGGTIGPVFRRRNLRSVESGQLSMF